MAQSTTILAFDQHADSIMAAVLPPGQRVPVIQQVFLCVRLVDDAFSRGKQGERASAQR